jgi:thioredoxin reductase (NADPH)
MKHYRQMKHYRNDEPLFVTGEIAPGMFALKTGRVSVRRCDPLGHLASIMEQGPGDFVAEIGQLSGRPALVDVSRGGRRGGNSHPARKSADRDDR